MNNFNDDFTNKEKALMKTFKLEFEDKTLRFGLDTTFIVSMARAFGPQNLKTYQPTEEDNEQRKIKVILLNLMQTDKIKFVVPPTTMYKLNQLASIPAKINDKHLLREKANGMYALALLEENPEIFEVCDNINDGRFYDLADKIASKYFSKFPAKAIKNNSIVAENAILGLNTLTENKAYLEPADRSNDTAYWRIKQVNKQIIGTPYHTFHPFQLMSFLERKGLVDRTADVDLKSDEAKELFNQYYTTLINNRKAFERKNNIKNEELAK